MFSFLFGLKFLLLQYTMPYYHSDSFKMPSIRETPDEILKARALDLSSQHTVKDISGLIIPDKNWGRITERNMIQGQLLVAEKPQAKEACAIDYQYQESSMCKVCNKYALMDESSSSCEHCGITTKQTDWLCLGCNTYFATKASLKRHHDRKKSCKELCEKKEDLSGNAIELPDKPYIIDWVDTILRKSISGHLATDQGDKPYCQFCEVEFANKSNLNKHLSKSVACDKLAKQEFLKLLQKMLKE